MLKWFFEYKSHFFILKVTKNTILMLIIFQYGVMSSRYHWHPVVDGMSQGAIMSRAGN